jgi:hypothetical protein
MPEVSKSAGVVIHCQPNSGLAELHWLDLEAGTEALHTALEVRRLRKYTPIHPFTPQQATAALYGRQRPGQVQHVDDPWRTATLDRISRIIVDGHAQALADAWPEGHPTLKSGEPLTLDQGDGISRTLDVLEKELGLPFASLPDLNPPPVPPKKSKRRLAVNDGTDTLVHTDVINGSKTFSRTPKPVDEASPCRPHKAYRHCAATSSAKPSSTSLSITTTS